MKQKYRIIMHFTFEVDVTRTKKVKTDQTNPYAMNCSKCKFTCHVSCIVLLNALTRTCKVMSWLGYCNVCPGKCSSTYHSVDDYRFEYHTVKETRKYEDIEERYKDATGNKLTVKQVIEKLQNEIQESQAYVAGFIEESKRSIMGLDEIALRPNTTHHK